MKKKHVLTLLWFYSDVTKMEHLQRRISNKSMHFTIVVFLTISFGEEVSNVSNRRES